MTFCQDRGDLGGGEAEAGRKRKVEQEFKRRGGAVRSVRIASTHVPRVMADDADAGLHRPNTERPVRSEARQKWSPRRLGIVEQRRDRWWAPRNSHRRCQSSRNE